MTYKNEIFRLPTAITPQRIDRLSMKLYPLIGNVITVFVDSGGISGNGFTGVLIEVLADSIKLITQLPSAPHLKGQRSNRKSSCNPKNQCTQFGTYTLIQCCHITAVTYIYQ